MMANIFEFFCVLCLCMTSVLLQDYGPDSQTLRLCVVEGRWRYKRASKFCPTLDVELQSSGHAIQCVLGTDRLDCLRRIGKGAADFGVFDPEDLVAAQWANVDVLVTNELRNRARPFQRSVVAVVNRRILPPRPTGVRAVLANTTLCHPGAGDNPRDLSDTMAEYLESLVVEKSCDSSLSLAENRILAMSKFFGGACKPGLWVPDQQRDAELKQKYSNLCSACTTQQCGDTDPYWGTSGALNCLASHVGDFTWAQLDDVEAYFGLHNTTSFAPADRFAYLCRDGSWQPLRDNSEPCVWLNRPWPVVVAKRKSAESVSALTSSLTDHAVTVDRHWRGALAALMEVNQALPQPLRPQRAPLDYLAAASGFREAYALSGCSVPRHITLCTTSVLARSKCEWLSEAGAVGGVSPALQCALAGDAAACLESVRSGASDVVAADSDWLVRAMRDYKISPVLYEATPILNHTDKIMAYARRDSGITTIDQLKGKKAAFAQIDGFSWHAVSQHLSKKDNKHCQNHNVLEEYFTGFCTPGIRAEKNVSAEVVAKYTKYCSESVNVTGNGNDEWEALLSMFDKKTDVAFVNMRKVREQYYSKIADEGLFLTSFLDDLSKTVVPLCPEDNKEYCFISWSHIGHLYARSNLTSMRRHEIVNVFTRLDQLFGKHYMSHSPMFLMYGPYNHQYNVLFHNNTNNLATDAIFDMHPYNKLPVSYERGFGYGNCELKSFSLNDLGRGNGAIISISSSIVLVFTTLVFVLSVYPHST